MFSFFINFQNGLWAQLTPQEAPDDVVHSNHVLARLV